MDCGRLSCLLGDKSARRVCTQLLISLHEDEKGTRLAVVVAAAAVVGTQLTNVALHTMP
jgi:hypothetical protein